jgi:hypothetical protein
VLSVDIIEMWRLTSKPWIMETHSDNVERLFVESARVLVETLKMSMEVMRVLKEVVRVLVEAAR